MHSSVSTGREPPSIPFYPNDPSSSSSFLPPTTGAAADPQAQYTAGPAASAGSSIAPAANPVVVPGSSYASSARSSRNNMAGNPFHHHHTHHQHNNSSSSSSSHHLSAGIEGYHHQQPQGSIAGPSSSASMPPPHFQPRGHDSGNDAVVDAVERVGKDLGAQLSSLSVQLSSLVSLMSQLVDGRGAEAKRRRFDSPPAHHNQHQQPPHSADGAWHDPQHTGTAHFRRDSNHPFAFDPAADEAQQQQQQRGGYGADNNDAMHQQYPQPPATADGSVIGDASAANGMTFYPAVPSINGNGQPPIDGAGGGNGGAPLAQADFYSTNMPGSVGFDVPHVESSRARPGSSYGSGRPFTAVDHSQRPTNPIPMAPPPMQQQQRIHFDMGQQQGHANHDMHRGSIYDGSSGASMPGPFIPHGGPHSHPASLSHSHSVDAVPMQSHSGGSPPHNSFTAPSASTSSSLKKRPRSSAPTRVSARSSTAKRNSIPEEESDDEIAGSDDEGNADASASMSMNYPTSSGRNLSPGAGSVTGVMGDWQMWATNPPKPPEAKLRSLEKPRWRTLQSARLDLQRKTGRTMAKLGRLPLRDYLEVNQTEYLAARKSGRLAYQEWLEPLKRLAKQDQDKVKACTNFIEYTHPMLAQCEASFKARQLLQQIIDNAIDEATNAKKKAESSVVGGGPEKRSASPPIGGASGGGASALSMGTRFASPRNLTRSAAAAHGVGGAEQLKQAQAMSF